MRALLAAAALLCWAGTLLAQTLPTSVSQALATARIPSSAVAISVQRVDADMPPLLQHNASVAMNPASVMKLLTTYAALEILGPATTWETSAWSLARPDASGSLPGDLYLKGSGDPKLTLEQFWGLLRQLQVRGVRHIQGDLILDRSAFDLPAFDPAAFDKQPLRAYNVGPDALLVDFHALRLSLSPTVEGVRLINETPLAGLVVQGQLTPTSAPCSGWRDRLDIRQSPGRLNISGDYPLACGETSLYLAPLGADAHVEALFRALWSELGGSLSGQVRRGLVPPAAERLTQRLSPPLAEVVRDVNKWSNNVMARQLFLALGQNQETSPARPATVSLTPERAEARLRQWLEARGLDFPELVLENGAGLSRHERISAAHMNRLLLAAWRSPVMPELLASLPIAGVDGTMRKRLRDTPVTGRAHVKTGSLEGVRSAAGYIMDASARRYAFTFIINHPQAAAGQEAMDELLLWVARQTEAVGQLSSQRVKTQARNCLPPGC